MPAPPSIACLALLVATTATLAQQESRDALPSPPPSVLTGRVERVYTSETPLPNDEIDTRYAIEVTLTVSTGEAYPAGKTIFVKTARIGKLPAGIDDLLKPDEVPRRGDIVEFKLSGGPGASADDGIRIVVPGSYKSESTSLAMTLVHTGEFLMGSPGPEANRRPDELQHRVKITKPFYLGMHEVTQFEYKQVMQVKPSGFSINGGSRDKVAKMITDRYPVENVSWFDAIEFCNRLSQKDGFEPYYTTSNVKREKDTLVEATVTTAGGAGYRLPTEAEWEYACRAGTTTPFHYGIESSLSSANLKAPVVAGGYGGAVPKWKDLGRTTKVGSFPANNWGLFDMHGNVAEWCGDWYDKDYYIGTPIEDPPGPQTGTHKVLRGGSWLMNDATCRSASRFFHLPREAKYYGGFRVARTP